MKKFDALNQEFAEFLEAASLDRAAVDRMHRAHALIRDALMREDCGVEVWNHQESAWAALHSARAAKKGTDRLASWRSYFLDQRAFRRLQSPGGAGDPDPC